MMNPSTVSGVHSVRIGRDGSMTDLTFFERVSAIDEQRCCIATYALQQRS
jgi:hypothetical protein